MLFRSSSSFVSDAIERLRSSLKRNSCSLVRSKRYSMAMSVADFTRCLMSSYFSKWSAARFLSLTTFESRRQSQLQLQKEQIVDSLGSFTSSTKFITIAFASLESNICLSWPCRSQSSYSFCVLDEARLYSFFFRDFLTGTCSELAI